MAAATQQLLLGIGTSSLVSDPRPNGGTEQGAESSDSAPDAAQNGADAGTALALVLGLEDRITRAALGVQVGTRCALQAVAAQDGPAGVLKKGGPRMLSKPRHLLSWLDRSLQPAACFLGPGCS